MSEKSKNRSRAIRVQYGALPYRWNHDGFLQILLVTSRETKRWILPKGWPIRSLKPAESAAREAFEEAGVRGTIGPKPIGAFTYEKKLDGAEGLQRCEVQIYPLLVERQRTTWPEVHERATRWMCAEEALDLLDDAGARDLVAAFVDRMSTAKQG